MPVDMRHSSAKLILKMVTAYCGGEGKTISVDGAHVANRVT